MDLSKLDVVKFANEGVKVELLNPFTDEPLTDEGDKLGDKDNIKPFFVRVLGSDSDVYRSGMKRKLESRFNKKKTNKSESVDLDHEERKGAELIAKCTTDCYFIENGKVVECTKAEMTRVYLKYPWMREQAEAQMGDRSALMQS